MDNSIGTVFYIFGVALLCLAVALIVNWSLQPCMPKEEEQVEVEGGQEEEEPK